MTKIAVFGAGTWGIALARLLAANGRDVTVWSAIPAELKSLSTTRRHPNLPGMELPATMHYTADIAEACTGRDILLFAVPSPFGRATAKKAVPHIPEGQIIVDVAKGVEDKTLMTMSEIIEDELTKAKRTARVVALSGPTHAEEVARDMPTARDICGPVRHGRSDRHLYQYAQPQPARRYVDWPRQIRRGRQD